MTQSEKGTVFRALHERNVAFIIPNPWDVGSARLLARLGFEALATTSAGYAFSLGRQDNHVGRDEIMVHAAEIVAASDLPVSADLENGFGDDPAVVADTVRLAADAGLVGCSVEDDRHVSNDRIYASELAVDRIRAAAEAARALPFTFTLTARCENYLAGNLNIAETIERLQAYQDAGADVLYAPGVTKAGEIEAIVSSVDRPVNVLMGIPGVGMGLAELSSLGVKRASVGSAMARAAYGSFLRAAREMKTHGTFGFADDAVPFPEISALFDESNG